MKNKQLNDNVSKTRHPNKIFYTQKEVSELFAISESSIKRMVQKDRFPHPRIMPGRKKRYVCEEVFDWANNTETYVYKRLKI